MPLIRRLPKRGFNNKRFKTQYLPINILSLNQFSDGDTVDASVFRRVGLANGLSSGIKILGSGELKRRLFVKASAFSATAKAAIEKLGGTAVVLL